MKKTMFRGETTRHVKETIRKGHEFHDSFSRQHPEKGDTQRQKVGGGLWGGGRGCRVLRGDEDVLTLTER